MTPNDKLKAHKHFGMEWNRYRIVTKGPRIGLGQRHAGGDLVDQKSSSPTGFIGFRFTESGDGPLKCGGVS